MATEIEAVVLDIEGTTTPITFVTDVLFKYVRENLEAYITQQWSSSQLQSDIKSLRELALEDRKQGSDVVTIPEGDQLADVKQALLKNIFAQMDQDRKSTALKALQGHMWQKGYASGELSSVLYDDVYEAFAKWREAQIPVYIYSSGSEEAQRLLFGHTQKEGDLRHSLAGYFDTRVGAKVDKSSYTNIASKISRPPGRVLFVTDMYLEAVAANEAGFHTLLAVRPGNKPLPADNKIKTIKIFSDIFDLFKFTH